MLAFVLLMAGCASRDRHPAHAVDGLSNGGGALAWEGLRVGMTKLDAERLLAAPLQLRPGETPVCGTHFSEVSWRGHQLTLQWSDDQSPVIQSIFVATTGLEPLASLRSRLKATLPDARFIPGPHDPEETESSDTTPLYRDERSGGVILLRSDGSPWSGLLITDGSCLE